MSLIKKPHELTAIREGGKRLGAILGELVAMVRSGVRTVDLDTAARKAIEAGGDTPSFLDYQPSGTDAPFPATLCVSVNEEVVHGVPSGRELREGDIVGLDLGLWHEGLCVDAARTVAVGRADDADAALVAATREALAAGIAAALAGAHVGDIGAAVAAIGRRGGYGIVEDLAGHGVGHAVHEEPYVPNVGKAGEGELLRSGMVLAIEPMFTRGTREVRLARDGFAYITRDRSRAAHFEDTIIITEEGAPEVVTN